MTKTFIFSLSLLLVSSTSLAWDGVARGGVFADRVQACGSAVDAAERRCPGVGDDHSNLTIDDCSCSGRARRYQCSIRFACH